MEELTILACSNYTHHQFFSSESEAHSMRSVIPFLSASIQAVSRTTRFPWSPFSTLPTQCFHSLSLKLSRWWLASELCQQPNTGLEMTRGDEFTENGPKGKVQHGMTQESRGLLNAQSRHPTTSFHSLKSNSANNKSGVDTTQAWSNFLTSQYALPLTSRQTLFILQIKITCNFCPRDCSDSLEQLSPSVRGSHWSLSSHRLPHMQYDFHFHDYSEVIPLGSPAQVYCWSLFGH